MSDAFEWHHSIPKQKGDRETSERSQTRSRELWRLFPENS